MAQKDRITTETADEAESAHDLFDAFAADGQLDPQEIAQMRMALDRVVFMTGRADLASALSVCVSRGGPDGWRFNDLMRQWQALEEAPAKRAA